MSFFEVLFGLGDCLFTETSILVKGVHEDAKQLGDELLHINDSNYVSPYQKKADAAAKIDKATDKIYKAKASFEKHYKSVGEKIQHNYQLKSELLGRICNSHSISSISNSIDINMPDRIYFTQRQDFKVGEFLGLFGHDIMDNAAEQYLEDARDYEVNAQALIARIHSNDAKLRNLEEHINMEEQVLSVLSKNLNLKTYEKKYQMANTIKNLMNMTICDKYGNIQDKYISELELLKNI